MSDLRMDVAAVTELGESLTIVADEFENANTRRAMGSPSR